MGDLLIHIEMSTTIKLITISLLIITIYLFLCVSVRDEST